MNGEWYFSQDGRPVGPTTFSYIARTAPLQPDMLVWCEGMPAWLPAREVPELAELLKHAPPPLPGGQVVGSAAVTAAVELPEPHPVLRPATPRQGAGPRHAHRRCRLRVALVPAIGQADRRP